MFHWINDKNFLSKLRKECYDAVNRLANSINADGKMTVKVFMVGSGGKRLEIQNENLPIDLDFDLEILDFDSSFFASGLKIKEYVKKLFDKALISKKWGNCSDSTSSLSTKKVCFKKGNLTSFSIDLAITKIINNKLNKLIHVKTGDFNKDTWQWQIVRDSSNLDLKVKKIKTYGFWSLLKEKYLSRKNFYLQHNDHNHPSYICYIEVVNDLYNELTTKHVFRE